MVQPIRGPQEHMLFNQQLAINRKEVNREESLGGWEELLENSPSLGFAKRYSHSYLAPTIQTVLSSKTADLSSESLQGPRQTKKDKQFYTRKLLHKE
jgi:hypothetical protein